MREPPRHRLRPSSVGSRQARLAVLVGAMALAASSCSGDGAGPEDASQRPTGGAQETASPGSTTTPSGPPCPRELPRPSAGSAVLGNTDPAAAAPRLPAFTQAWRCVYRGSETDDGRDESWVWERLGAASDVADSDLERYAAALTDLRPAPADQVCTLDLGPRTLLVLEHDTGRVGVLADRFGCGSVRLTDDPAQVPAGEATTEGIVAGVLQPSAELRLLMDALRIE